jgi:hypothetical protein
VDAHAHVTDVGGAVGSHDHVVERAARRRRQVGVDHQAAIGFQPHEALRLHRHQQQPAVPKPAEARRLVVDAHDGVGGAVERGADDAVVVHVAAPEPALVPPRALGEHEVVEDGAHWRSRHARTVPGLCNVGQVESDLQRRRGRMPGTPKRNRPL